MKISRFTLAILTWMLSACSPAQTPTTLPASALTPTLVLATAPKDIVGKWKSMDGVWSWQFDQDGNCRGSASVDRLTDNPMAECIYRFEGTHFILTIVRAEVPCPDGNTPAIYEVQKLANGGLRFLLIADDCPQRVKKVFTPEYAPVP
jgi:hypothetical protein